VSVARKRSPRVHALREQKRARKRNRRAARRKREAGRWPDAPRDGTAPAGLRRAFRGVVPLSASERMAIMDVYMNRHRLKTTGAK
jgi:hypothetical protein